MPAPPTPCFGHLFDVQVERTPDAVAVVAPPSGDRLSYRELDRRATRLALALAERGAGPEVRVGLLLERSADLVVAILGILKAGGAYVPLDPAYPRQRLDFILADSRVRLIVAHRHLLTRFPGLAPAEGEILGPESEDGSAGNPLPEILPASAAYVIYTSGSTGKPRGVVVEHRSLGWYAATAGSHYRMVPGDRVLQISSVSFDISVSEIFPCLARGATLVLRNHAMAASVAELYRRCREWAVTVLLPATAFWHEMARAAAADPSAVPSTLRLVSFGGERVAPEWVAAWRRSVGPRLRLCNGYGPTETTVEATLWECRGETVIGADAAEVPIGRPVAGVRIRVLDRGLEAVPAGETGELAIAGCGVARGYLDRPAATAERFIPHPQGRTPGERLYRTGDLVRLRADGNLEFVGRADEQAKIRGFRVEPGEIEAVLRQHPMVRDAAVVAAGRRLVAYVVPQPSAEPDAKRQAWHEEYVHQTRELYEDLYQRISPDQDPTFNTLGWISSYTGRPIPGEEMKEWVGHTVERILRLRPRRVLEIGCGSGLLLFRIAPRCDHYLGTDFSPSVLDSLARSVRRLPQVTLSQRLADDFEGLGKGAFDTVVLNSVAQHFPSIEYLARVLAGAVDVTAAGGAIFVGDVRSLVLHEAFCASVELCRSPPSRPLDEVRQRIRRRLLREPELVIAPAFFLALKHRLPRIREVRIQPKAGRYHNELTRFRYDVVIELDGPQAETPAAEVSWLNWHAERTPARIGRQLAAQRPRALGIAGVANPRLARENAILRRLAEPGDLETAADLEPATSETAGGIEPDAWRDLCRAAGYEHELSWSRGAADGSYDVLLWRPEQRRPRVAAEVPGEITDHRLANDPLRHRVLAGREARLREHLARQLPEYMLPAAWAWLPVLPRLPNGKIDRAALSRPPQRPASGAAYIAPRSPIETTLVEIWAEVLGMAADDVGVDDNFFELGGHSLLAAQLISRVRQRFGVELPVGQVFARPRLAELSSSLERMVRSPDRGDGPPPLRRVPRDRELPLSFAQQRLWFLDQLAPGNAAYNVPVAWHLQGRLDFAALDAAWREIVRRHESLRTTFPSDEGRPRQAIAASPEPLVLHVDLRALPPPRCRCELDRLTRLEAARPFDLARGPLLRMVLVRLGGEEHVLLRTVHHIVYDGWSEGVLRRELGILYAACARGRPSPLPEPEIRYADFAVWQRRQLSGETLDALLAWWRRELAGLAVFELPTDRQRGRCPCRGAVHAFELSAELTRALGKRSIEAGASLSMTLLTGFMALLGRTAGREDVVVGSPVAQRGVRELEGLVGFFVNMLVMRGDLSGDPPFAALLARLRRFALGALAHQDLPFDLLVGELAPQRHRSRHPLFQISFGLQNAPSPALKLTGLAVSPLQVQPPAVPFDLHLDLWPDDDRLRAHVVYDAALFDASTIARFAEHYRRLLVAAMLDPELRLGELPLLSRAERHALLVEWSTGPRPEPARWDTIHQLITARAKRSPEAMAVVFADDALSYGELERRADRLARRLRTLGVGPETRVALGIGPSLEMVVGVLGILKAGGAYVPLDPDWPPARAQLQLEDVGAAVLVTASPWVGRLPPHPRRVLLDKLPAGRDDVPASPASPVGAGNAAYVLYTSGSSGRPKGVVISHCNVLCSTIARLLTYPPGTFLLIPSLAFDSSVAGLFGTLGSGGTLILVPQSLRADAAGLGQVIARHRVTQLLAIPALYRLILGESPAARLASLETVIVAGEACPPELVEQHRQILPKTRLWNEYGPTEATVWASVHPCTQKSTIQEVESERVPIGRPIPGACLRVLDRRLDPVLIGVAGELWIGGTGVARGYWRQPMLTAARFLPDPRSLEAGARLYRTGDRVRWLGNGAIEFLGRCDAQVKIRGVRVEPGEIEAVLERHPAIGQAVVVVAGERLAAHVVPRGRAPGAGELRSFAAGRLLPAMVPAIFVTTARLPRLPNGKVDRGALARRAPDRELSERGTPAAPRTPQEEMLTAIWAGVLGRREIGIHDNFFELGGHSLLAARVISQVRRTFCIELPLGSLFERPTVAELAPRLERAQQAASIPLEPMSRDRTLPLSFAQQRLWFLDQLAPRSPAYNVAAGFRLEGRLDRAALAAAVYEVRRRHEALRTIFPPGESEDGQPRQVILPAAGWSLPVIDLTRPEISRARCEAHRLVDGEAVRPFSLKRGPLFRPALLRLAAAEHVLLLHLHHIVTDGWSQGILYRELATLYAAFRERRPSPLPELVIQYADFAVWQRRRLSAEVLAPQLAYWRRQLDALPALRLPADRPLRREPRGALHPLGLPASLNGALWQLGIAAGSSLSMTLVAAWMTLLHRITGQDDIVVGTPIAHRNREELEGLIGFFLNTLVLRGDLSGNPSFRELVERVREVALAAYADQDLPFEKLVEALRPERETDRQPLFQVSFTMQHEPPAELELPGLDACRTLPGTGTPQFELELHLWEKQGRLHGCLAWDRERFTATSVARWAEGFERLLAQVAADPDLRLGEVRLMSRAQLHQLLCEWNDTRSDFPEQGWLGRLLAAQARRTPERVALAAWPDLPLPEPSPPSAEKDGGRYGPGTLSYRQLGRRVRHLAARLRSLGIGPETRVGILIERGIELVVALMAVVEVGGAYVPLDPTDPTPRLSFQCEDSGIALLLTRTRWRDVLPWRGITLCLDSGWDRGEPAAAPASRLRGESPAYVLYTSGSTGRPKGVVITHRALANHMLWMQDALPLDADDRVLQKTPVGFDASVWEFWAPLLVGARLILARPGGHRDPAALVREIRRHRVSILQVVPSLLRALLEQPGFAPCRSLRRVICGGEALDAELRQRFLERGPPAALVNVYGPTEGTIHAAFARCRETGGPVPVGRPIANAQVLVLDRRLRPVAIGVGGELCVGGAGLARGYLERPRLTAERFLPHPLAATGCRLYRTGDLARHLPDGSLEVLGRIDHQIKIRGHRIEPGEIEGVLSEHPAVSHAVVAAREARGGKRLIAYVVLRSREASAAELRTFAQQRLPAAMVPAAFTVLESLPLLPSGKVDRTALPEPAPPPRSGVPPGTSHEEMLAAIWAEVLERDAVGVDEDFFALGGHSLLATRVIARVREAFRVELALRRIFEQPTVAQLAREVAALRRTAAGLEVPPLIAQSRPPPPLPLSFAQQRLWFLDQLEPGNAAYHMPSAFRLRGNLEMAALAAAVGGLVRRHEVLRTSFPSRGGRAGQLVGPGIGAGLPLVDLAVIEPGRRREEVRRLLSAEALRPFALSRGPVLRFGLLRLGFREHVLYFVIHHIASDGWSQGVLLRDLAGLYTAALRGAPARLGKLPIQYADFALWQRRWLRGAALAKLLRYWRRQLRTLPLPELPTDRPRPAARSYLGATRDFALPAAAAAALRRLSRGAGASLYMTLLAVWAVLLHRLTGQEDVVVGSPIANRRQREIEDLIGFFVNSLVLRLDLAGQPRFYQLLERVRETALEAFAHQDLPFEKLVEELSPPRDLSRHPLFQVSFALQNAPAPDWRLPGLTAVAVEFPFRRIRFDLELYLWEETGVLRGTWVHSTELWEATTIARWAEHFETLLGALAADPALRPDEVTLLTRGQRHQLLVEWSGAPRRPASDDPACLHQLFEAQVARTPEAVALVCDRRRLSYGELDRRADQLAHHLRGRGVGPEAVVGLRLPRSPEMVVGLLAVLKAGGAYLPLPLDDPRYRSLVEDARPALILTRESAVTRESRRRPACRIAADHPAYVLFTSGSTGRPKGVVVPHRAVVGYLRWALGAYAAPGDGAPVFSSLAFDLTVTSLFLPLLRGQPVVLLAEDDGVDALVRILGEGRRFALLKLTPSHLDALDRLLPDDQLLDVGVLVLGGEPLPPAALAFRFRHMPGARLVNEYGPTEATVGCVVWEVPAAPAASATVAIGRPIAGVEAYVLDRRLSPVPAGVAGQLHIAGPGLARGYLDAPRLSAEKFIPSAFGPTPGGRLYRTGDLVRHLPDGRLEFLGRVDRQVKIRGFRIEPGEIEAALRRHPGVREAAVVAADSRLVAWLVPAVAEDDLRQEHLAHWQALYDDLYRATPDDLVGWNSSDTGRPIPAGEMREWVDETVERILSLDPCRVIEIGCGTGLLLRALAPHTRCYLGTDFSLPVLEHLRLRPEVRGLSQVELSHRPADDFTGIEAGAFDTVVINSVVQYFPGVGYLLEVLRGAVEATAPGGSIFVGDVRSLPLHEAFCAAVELDRSADSLPLAELRRRIRRRRAEENELLIDPAFFTALGRELPRIAGVRIRLKGGRARNELTRFRYDVLLDLDRSATAGRRRAARLDWRPELTLDTLRRRLAQQRPADLVLRGVRDPRLAREIRLLELLAAPGGRETVGELRQALTPCPPGLEPADVLALSRELSCAGELLLPRSGVAGTYDVIFRRMPGRSSRGLPAAGAEPIRPWPSYGNDPLRRRTARRWLPRLRDELREQLPEHMVPAAFELLDELPRTAGGKVDRDALGRDASARTAGDGDAAFVAPRTAAERLLARIWAEVLGLERVGAHDNFFALGGDSLLGIQVVASARQESLRLTPKDLFRHQTVAELARVAPAAALASRTPALGPVPLTPIQRWFFERRLPEPWHFNQAMLLEASGSLDPVLLERATGELLRRHHSLRLRFACRGGEWRQWSSAFDGRVPFVCIELSRLGPEDHRRAVDVAAGRLQASLDLTAGPLVRVAHFRAGRTGTERLLVVIHHLGVDLVSWSFLLADLESAYRRLEGVPSAPPAGTMPLREWAERLGAYARSEALQQEADFWLDLPRRVEPLPVDRAGGANSVASAATVSATLDPENTHRLLRRLPGDGSRVLDVLLTALARTFRRWTGGPLLVDLEGHGREAPIAGADVSRTSGWFTTIFPVVLELGEASTDDLKTVREQMAAVPGSGIGYGLLRYLSPDGAKLRELRARPRPEVCFNYLGQLDGMLAGSTLFAGSDEASGPAHSRRGLRSHLVEINCGVSDGRLWTEWTYSCDRHRRATVEGLSRQLVAELAALITHCLRGDGG